jgi:arsenate reductase
MGSKNLKTKVLFICKHNSARSQMAEGLLNSIYGEYFEAYSAGTDPDILNPCAVKVMADRGYRYISRNRSKSLKEFEGKKFDYMVTVCEGESGACPFFPGGRTHIHRSFPDPSVVDEDTKVKVFTRLRDEIEEWIKPKFQDDIPLKPDAI